MTSSPATGHESCKARKLKKPGWRNGRRNGLKIRWPLVVGVRVPSRAPLDSQCFTSRKIFSGFTADSHFYPYFITKYYTKTTSPLLYCTQILRPTESFSLGERHLPVFPLGLIPRPLAAGIGWTAGDFYSFGLFFLSQPFFGGEGGLFVLEFLGFFAHG